MVEALNAVAAVAGVGNLHPVAQAPGSAHCCLGPCWSERLGKTELTAFQAYRRGVVVTVKLADDRVILGGQAVAVLDGYFFDT